MLPLLTVKYIYIQSIHKLCIRLNEIIYRINNDIGCNNSYNYEDSIKTTVNSMYSNLLSCARDISTANTLEEVNRAYDNFNIYVMTLSGLYATYSQIRYASLPYGDYYVNNADDHEESINDALRHVQESRSITNVFTILGSEPYSGTDSFECSFMDPILRSSHVVENNNMKYYCFIDNNTGSNSMSDYNNYLEKYIIGSTSDVRISNNFDIGIMGFNVYEDFREPTYVKINEKVKNRFLLLNTHVGINGLEIIFMPRIFANENVLEYICGYLDDIQIYSHVSNSRIIALAGKRRRKNIHDLAYEINVMLNVLAGTTSDRNITYSNQESEKIIFRSAVPQLNDINNAIARNLSFINKVSSNISKQLVVKTEEDIKHPLIPFSPGQLGLVLVSGKIDGIVDEGNNVFHVIKGTTYKTDTRRTGVDEEGHVTNTTTYSTATSVTMLTADGTFKELR